jgi:hypothetical protein
MDSIEDYDKQWAKRKKEDVSKHSFRICEECELVDTNWN